MSVVKQIRTRRRRWFRYSLRTFLLLVTITCIVLGLYVKRQRDRHVAIETILGWGGVVDFTDWRAVNVKDSRDRFVALMGRSRTGRPRPVFPPQGDAWQRRIFGKYYGSSIVRVSISKSPFSPTDATIDVRVLSYLPDVKRLGLGEPIDDDALQRLPRLPSLETLNLMSNTNVSDRGMECLARLPKLKFLQVMYGSFTAVGLARIGAARNLSGLMLYRCELTDDGLAHLSGLKNLGDLWLQGSTISDAGIVHLSRFHGLRNLDISDTSVTKEGVNRLRRALPNCIIRSSFLEAP